jgi:hypothetical protein
MSTEDKKEQAINPQPEYDEPSAPSRRPEDDESRIGGQAADAGSASAADTPENEDERTGEGTGARAGEYG